MSRRPKSTQAEEDTVLAKDRCIVETPEWVSDDLDIRGPTLLSLTGYAHRLRMHCLLAYVTCKPTMAGVSFIREAAWEYDQVSGSGRVTLAKDARLKGLIRIKDGDSSSFVTIRAEEPDEPIAFPRTTETVEEA